MFFKIKFGSGIKHLFLIRLSYLRLNTTYVSYKQKRHSGVE